jgi:hypothetical protein
MRALSARLLGAVSDATIGTAIVMVHLVLAGRGRARARGGGDGTWIDGRPATMKTNDPELSRILTDERKTVDLCAVDHKGARCVRERGHEGQHECPRYDHFEPLRWG